MIASALMRRIHLREDTRVAVFRVCADARGACGVMHPGQRAASMARRTGWKHTCKRNCSGEEHAEQRFSATGTPSGCSHACHTHAR